MSVLAEISRLSGAKSDIAASITAKGVTVPTGTMLDGMSALIDTIATSGGGAQVTVGTVTLSSASQTMSITGLSFTPSRVMLIMTAGSGTTNNRVRSAYSDGSALYCQRYTGASLIGATVTSNYLTGSVAFGGGTIALSTGSSTYTFMYGTWTYVAWTD